MILKKKRNLEAIFTPRGYKLSAETVGKKDGAQFLGAKNLC